MITNASSAFCKVEPPGMRQCSGAKKAGKLGPDQMVGIAETAETAETAEMGEAAGSWVGYAARDMVETSEMAGCAARDQKGETGEAPPSRASHRKLTIVKAPRRPRTTLERCCGMRSALRSSSSTKENWFHRKDDFWSVGIGLYLYRL